MKYALVAAAILALAGTAHAQSSRTTQMQTGASPLYGELGYSHLDVTSSGGGVSIDGKPGLLRGIIGYELHPNIAVEGMLGFGVRDANVSGTTGLGVPFSGDLRVQNTFGAFVKPKLDLGAVEVFTRLGYAQTRTRSAVQVGAFTGSTSDSEADFAYGVGANWKLSPSAYVGLDLMRYYDKDQTRVDGLTLSVGTRF